MISFSDLSTMPDCELSDHIESKYIIIDNLIEFSRNNSREFLDVMIE